MSLPIIPRVDLPTFVVISGENGSGKSQLLQGVWQQQIATELTGNQQDFLYLTTAQLGNPPELAVGGETREQQVARIEGSVQQARSLSSQANYDTREKLISATHDLLQPHLPPLAISTLEMKVGKPFLDWTHEDFVNNTPSESANRDLFSVSVAEVFSRYNQIVTANDVEDLRQSRGQGHGLIRTPEEIEEVFGRPPWELLNSALESVGLPFHFDPPEPSMMPSVAPPQLIDDRNGAALPVSALSSGERTLMSIALSFYSANGRREYLRIPRVVLLDEPDATLHPSMIQSLLRLVQELFIDSLGIQVIIVTHSPTTVALAPPQSLYIMSRSEPRIRAASSTDEALANLLVGVPSVSVIAENRRIVIVESPKDERRYTDILNLLGNRVNREKSLVFMAAGSSALPNGSAAVIDLVARLRANGNRAVWGLVDRDTRDSQPSQWVHMDSARYTIENLVVDPVSLGLYLLLENFSPTVTALEGIDYAHFTFDSDAQQIVDYVGAQAAPSQVDFETTTVQYVGGALQVPDYWLDEPGHELVDRLIERFPYLARFQQDKDRLLDEIIDRIWRYRPELIPRSMVETLDILTAS